MEHQFHMAVSVDEATGEIQSAYFTIRKGRTAQTKEFGEGTAFADYDSKGKLLGIELLAPCKISLINEIEGTEPEVKRFVKRTAPREMVTA